VDLGKSKGGKPTEKKVKEDGIIMFKYLMELGYTSEHIILYGASIGGIVALHLAQNGMGRCAILLSTFAKITDIVPKWLRWLCKGFNNINYKNDTQIPIIILHSPHDRLISYNSSVKLYDHLKKIVPTILFTIYGDHLQHFIKSDTKMCIRLLVNKPHLLDLVI